LVAKIDNSAKDLYKVLLKRPLTKEEQLLRSMMDHLEEDEIELELKKNFFYVVNPDGKVIDCAKIYSFLHENNIYQRIIAKVAQDMDQRISLLTK
jgi:hypothetical protein